MNNGRQKLAREFWDRSEKLSVHNEDYSLYAGKLISEKLIEDCANNDLTTGSLISKHKKIKATVVAKQDGIIAGLDESFLFDLKIKKLKNDGDNIRKGDFILEIHDNARKILRYERTLLNLLQRMSGIATSTHNLKKSIRGKCFIAGTRKTLFLFDKKAVSIGGGLTHRLNLKDLILIKDNHLKLLGNDIGGALKLANRNSKVKYIEIEVKNGKEALESARTILRLRSKKSFAVMFDNMDAQTIKDTIIKINNILKKEKPENKRYGNGIANKKVILFEASGGITEKNILEYSKTGVDAISSGMLTHSAGALDLSLEILG